MTTPTPVLYPIIERPSRYARRTRYAHLNFKVMMREYVDGEYRYDDPSHWGEEKKWHNLRINSQMSEDYDHVYAIQLEYRTNGGVEYREAEVMWRMLSTHKKKMDKLREEWGSPATYSEFVLRTIKAIGIKHVATIDADGGIYLTADPNAIREWIDRTVADLMQSVQPSSHIVNEIAQPTTPAPDSIPDDRPQPKPYDAVLGTGITG